MSDAESLIDEYGRYAQSKGFHLNPDKKVVTWVVEALISRNKSLGEKYCPCRRVTGDKKEDKKIICPCIYHISEIEKDGHCHCNLFVR